MHTRKAAKLTIEVKNQLKDQITSGSFNPGDCIPSERTLLKKFEVSRVTIRRSLKELVKEGLLVNKIGSGYFLPTNSDLIKKEELGDSIVFLHNNDFDKDANLVKLWQGAREFCIKNGRNIIVKSIDKSEGIKLNLEELKKISAGIISDFSDTELIMQIYRAGIPIVQIYHPAEKLPIDTIIQDDIHGIQSAYDHLINKGHRRIIFLDKSHSYGKVGSASYNHLRRKLGYQFAAEQSGTYDPELILRIGYGDDFLNDTDETLLKVAKLGATALIFPNAIDHKRILTRLQIICRKYSVHKNTSNAIQKGTFGIISWGDNNVNNTPDPTTYVNWSKEQMGQEGVRRLFERMREPNLSPVIITIPTHLVEGNSSGRGPYFNQNLN